MNELYGTAPWITAMSGNVISISHWGQFEIQHAPVFALPKGWKIKDLDQFIEASKRPSGYIELTRL